MCIIENSSKKIETITQMALNEKKCIKVRKHETLSFRHIKPTLRMKRCKLRLPVEDLFTIKPIMDFNMDVGGTQHPISN